MKQVTQRLRDGRIDVVDVPPPRVAAGGVLVDVRASLLSAGTERSKVVAGRQSLLGKARSRPDQVRQVVEKARREGIGETVTAVRSRLAQPSPLGYSSAGVVLAVGDRVADVLPGDPVACGGAGAAHADVAHVPVNLCVPVPEGVGFDEAAFATVGAIALHGVRQADARIGERVAVIGLGLVGQLAAQILRAAGCFVVGVDLDERLVELSRSTGTVDAAFVRSALDLAVPSEAEQCDAVLVTAATPSSDPVRLAAVLARDRGRVVVVGDVGIDVPRTPYYDKELELRISRSYGPGRYDVEYEERGLDYPIGYVRWTERRNMRAFLELVARGSVDVKRLITARVALDDAPEAYERLIDAGSPLGIVLEYGATELPKRPAAAPAPRAVGGDVVGVVGAGSFARRVLIPGLRGAGFTLGAVASAGGLSAHSTAADLGFARAVTPDEAIADPSVALVAIASRHASHTPLAVAALEAGKSVFVEKPPAVTPAQLEELRDARDRTGGLVAVGFNRRHAPLAARLKAFVREPGTPVELLYRVNAGRLAPDHWLNDLDDGGGRLVGEGCHFVDFACWVMDDLPNHVLATLRPDPGRPIAAAQSFAVTLTFPAGSAATIVYTADGAPGLAKEYVEAHAGGRTAILDDFRSLRLLGQGASRIRARAGRGHKEQFAALHGWVSGTDFAPGPDPLATMSVVFAALRSAETGAAVSSRPAE